MPYIDKEARDELAMPENPPVVAGELNYLIIQACLEYLRVHSISYATFNDIIGALECAKMEMYRRLVGPYENIKIFTNGDVFPHQIVEEVSRHGTESPRPTVQTGPETRGSV